MLKRSQYPEKQKKSIPGKRNSKCKDPGTRRRNSKVDTVAGMQGARDRGDDDKSCGNWSSQNTLGLAGLANCEQMLLEGLKQEHDMVCFIF